MPPSVCAQSATPAAAVGTDAKTPNPIRRLEGFLRARGPHQIEQGGAHPATQRNVRCQGVKGVTQPLAFESITYRPWGKQGRCQLSRNAAGPSRARAPSIRSAHPSSRLPARLLVRFSWFMKSPAVARPCCIGVPTIQRCTPLCLNDRRFARRISSLARLGLVAFSMRVPLLACYAGARGLRSRLAYSRVG